MSKDMVQELFSVGAHFGYRRSHRHPSVQPYLYGQKGGVDIFDLTKTVDLLAAAQKAAAAAKLSGKPILFVGSKSEARSAVTRAAERLGQPYVTGRWIGGTITNFSEIRKRIDRLEKLLSDKEKGALDHYTKKEQLMFDREIERLQNMFGGLSSLTALPALLVVVDPLFEKTAMKEAKQAHIPVVALANTDCHFKEIDYPIPANDAARQSITFIIDEIARAIDEAGTVAASEANEEGKEKK